MTSERATNRPFHFTQRLRDIDRFFRGKDPVHQTMRRAARRLERVGIPYAVVGGMAVNAHRHRRTTGDVDLLLTEEGVNDFCARFVGRNYSRVPDRPFRLVDRTSQVTVDILVTGMFPGSGEPGTIAYPDPDDVSETIDTIRVLNLEALIQLKLAARRYKDFGDVVELIRSNNLEESFAERLHVAVRGDYLECLEEKRREDLYEARRTWPPKHQAPGTSS